MLVRFLFRNLKLVLLPGVHWCRIILVIRAEVARRIGGKYFFRRRHIPRIGAALGLDDPCVQAAFSTHGDQAHATIYQEKMSYAERPRWACSRLSSTIESLPPFWTAFALTITETVGAGTLALPIAFATVGPLAGVLLLVLLGLINLVTVAYLAEASARNGSMRYGSSFVGRLVQDYLGTPASIVLRIALFAFCCIVLASYYTGFASTLSAVTGIPAPFWVTVVFGTGLFLILRKSLIGTLTSALLIGIINISILVIMSIIALNHATAENLLHLDVPFRDGRVFEPSNLQLVFGIVLVSYFGHLSVSNCAQAVLRRDPDGRSLKRGTIAAMIVAIVIYSLWSLSVGGAVGSEKLLGETGTALVPLAAAVGPQIYILGVVFAVLGLGMSSVHFGLGIFNMSRELSGSVDIRQSKSWFRDHRVTITSLLPVLIVFGYVQWTYFNGTASFTAPLELLGAILTPVLAGIFPVLLLAASRAQGLPVSGAKLSRVASSRLVLGFIVVLSFAGLLFHGLIIWEEPVSRVAALATAAGMILLIAYLVRQKVFSPSTLIEIRYFPEEKHSAQILIAFNGNIVDCSPVVRYADGTEKNPSLHGVVGNYRDIHSIKFNLPAGGPGRLLVNAHSITADLEAYPLSGCVSFLSTESKEQIVELDISRGLTRLVLPAGQQRLSLRLSATSRRIAVNKSIGNVDGQL